MSELDRLRGVIVVSDFANINGGQAKVAIDSARLLAESGLDVTFFAGGGEPDAALDHPGIRVVALGQNDILSDPNRLRAMSRGIWNAGAARALRKEIARHDPACTVLHAHGYAKVLSPSIGPILTDGPLPAVYTMHEYFLACPNGGFYDYQKGEICTRHALGASCLATNCDVRRPAHKAWRVARQVATWGPGRMPRGLRDVIYISETQRRVMAPYLSARTRLHHVPNPVDLPDPPPVDTAANDIFLFVGRLNREKGGLMFAEAAKAAGVKAVFVGDGPDAKAIRTTNPEAVITGWQTPAQVQEWLSRARALVFPSLWYEGQPLVPMEAIARGVPVICGSWSAATEVVLEGKTGWLYDRPDEEALAGALRAAIVDGMAVDRVVAMANFSPAEHLRRLTEVYKALIT